MSITRVRLERLADDRARIERNIEEVREKAEAETRELNEFETEQVETWRSDLKKLDSEIEILAEDVERQASSRDVSKLIRVDEAAPASGVIDRSATGGPVVYRTFAAYARDSIVAKHPTIAAKIRGPEHMSEMQEEARERLMRVEHTLTSDVEGLLPSQHMAQIMDIINASRPVVASARSVDLSSGKLTYPKIQQRPEVLKQGTEKTEAGTANMQITLEDMNADTYLGGGNLSWQTINWSTPSALQLWFDLAAEAYARQTETAACGSLESAALGTNSPALGTVGTESFAQWSAAALGAISGIYTRTAGRARTNTLYLAADRFFALAGLGTDQVTQVSQVGNLNVDAMTGSWRGLRVIGSYGFAPHTAIVGDSAAFLVGETPGAPVEMRAVEPAIGGMEVGVIGAFKSVVFDEDRFQRLS